jgi:flagellar biosynthesis chaperone FliJ
MSVANLNKEVLRFTIKFKQEVLQDILKNVTEETGSPYYVHINEQLNMVSEEIKNFEKSYRASLSQKGPRGTKQKTKSLVPRPMSAYNKFIKQTLPKIKKDLPDMDNKSRMSKASEIWKKLTPSEKEEYSKLEF